MSTRYEVSDEPAYSNSYSWRSSAKLKLDELGQIDPGPKSVAKREIYDGGYRNSAFVLNNSVPLARSVDLFSSPVGYAVNSNGTEWQSGRSRSPDLNSTASHEYVPVPGVSRTETPSGSRKSYDELTRSSDFGSHAWLPSSSYNKRSGRSETVETDKGHDRVKNRPPIAPGRPRPQPSDSLPRSGTPATYSRATATERSSFLSNSKGALHSSLNSLDNLRHSDQQHMYDKHVPVRTSIANFLSERPGSRNSDADPLSHVQPGTNLRSPEERGSSANAVKSLLAESRPRSALAGSHVALDRSGTPVTSRSFAGTPDFVTGDKSSSLRHSTDINLGASYDEIVKRLRMMETRTHSGHQGMKPDIAADLKELESETRRSIINPAGNVSKKKSTAEYSTKIGLDEYDYTDGLKTSSAYDRNSPRGTDKFQYKYSSKPRINENSAELSNQSKTYLDLSNRTGERMSAYSKNGAIESWLRTVTNESTEQLHDVNSTFKDSSISSGGHLENRDSDKEKSFIKRHHISNGFDEKVKNERSRKLSKDSYQRTTPPAVQTRAKSSMGFTDSTYHVDKPAHATRRGFEPELYVAKQERYLSSQEPSTRSDSRLSLLRKYLDQADSIGTQADFSAVDNGYLKLPDELGMDELRRSSSALDHRNTTRDGDQFHGSSRRKVTSDLSRPDRTQKPVHTTSTKTWTPSIESFNDKDVYSGVSSTLDKRDGYQNSGYGQRDEDPIASGEKYFKSSNDYSFNALTSSTERPKSPTKVFGVITDKGYDNTVHYSELTRDLTKPASNHKDNEYTGASIHHYKTPLHSSNEQDLMSRSYEKPGLDDAGKTKEKNEYDPSSFQLTGGYADSRTLLSILENNRKYKSATTTDSNQILEAKYSIRTTAEQAKLSEKGGVDTTTNVFSRSSKDQKGIENEPGRALSGSGFSSLEKPKRAWYSEEHLAPSTVDADNDISVKFDYRPDTFRYVLRKAALSPEVDKRPVPNGVQERSSTSLGHRKWRSDLALFGDNLESRDHPHASTFDSRNNGLSVHRSSSFRSANESRAPERRQVTWKDEVRLAKEIGGSSSAALNSNVQMHGEQPRGDESFVSQRFISFKRSLDRLQSAERPGMTEDSIDRSESHSLYQKQRSQSPSTRSFLASTLSTFGTDDDHETKPKETASDNSNPISLRETSSNYQPSSYLNEGLTSQSPSSKSFLASTWSASSRAKDLESKLKDTQNGDSNPTSLRETSSNYRSSSSLHEGPNSLSSFSKNFMASTLPSSSREEYQKSKLKESVIDISNTTFRQETPTDYRSSSYLHEDLRSHSPSSKSFLASTWSASSREKDLELKLKGTANGDPNPTPRNDFSSDNRPSSSLYESLRSQSPTSRSFLASTGSASGRDENRETKVKQTSSGYSTPTSLRETSSSYRPSSPSHEGLRSKSPSSRSYLASTWSPSAGDEDRKTTPKQTLNSESKSTFVHEASSSYRPSHRPSSGLSSTSYTYSAQEPLATKASNTSLYGDYNKASTTNQSKPTTNDGLTYKHYTPTENSVANKTSAYLSTDSIYKSSYSPARYTSTDLQSPPDSHSNDLSGRYVTPDSVTITDEGRASSPYSSLRIREFLASRSASKSPIDSYQPDSIPQETWRPTSSNGAPASIASNAHHHQLPSSTYASSSHRDSAHFASASLLDSSAKELNLISSSWSHRGDKAPESLTTSFPHDADHLATGLMSSTYTSVDDDSATGLPYKYLSYANHVAPSSNYSNSDTRGQSPARPFSDPYPGHRVLPVSSRSSSSRDDLRHIRSDSLTNGVSAGADFLSGIADKHDDGLSLVSETEFVVMRSGDIVKRPFKKPDRTDAHIQSRYSKSLGYAGNHLGLR